jgi:hypothetical protein
VTTPEKDATKAPTGQPGALVGFGDHGQIGDVTLGLVATNVTINQAGSPVTTALNDAVSSRKESPLFIDRQDEVAYLDALVEMQDNRRVVTLFDKPGVGKTTLIRYFESKCRRRNPPVYYIRVDIRNEYTPFSFVKECARRIKHQIQNKIQLPPLETEEDVQDAIFQFCEIATQNQPIVLLVDSTELMSAQLSQWFVEEFLPICYWSPVSQPLPLTKILLVLAGSTNIPEPKLFWRDEAEQKEYIAELTLSFWDDAAIAEYLSHFGLRRQHIIDTVKELLELDQPMHKVVEFTQMLSKLKEG